MSDRFVGKYFNTIDQKNRIIVPSKHRDLLKGKCFVSKGMDKCLNIYTVGKMGSTNGKTRQPTPIR